MLNKAFPGPFTFILEASSHLPSVFRNRKKTIGLRVPDNKIVQAIIEKLGHPIIATSLHDIDAIREYPTDPNEIFELYQHQVDGVVDGGIGSIVPSTVVDCTGDEPVITRQGLGEIVL